MVLILLCTNVMPFSIAMRQHLTMNGMLSTPAMFSTIGLAPLETILILPVASSITAALHVLVILRRVAIMMAMPQWRTIILAIPTDTMITTITMMIADIHPTTTIKVHAATIAGTTGTGEGTADIYIFLSCTSCF
jgi:hypothetical protein